MSKIKSHSSDNGASSIASLSPPNYRADPQGMKRLNEFHIDKTKAQKRFITEKGAATLHGKKVKVSLPKFSWDKE
jgi:hypothetical protein